jgi:hypothetical protein
MPQIAECHLSTNSTGRCRLNVCVVIDGKLLGQDKMVEDKPGGVGAQ